MTDAVGLLSGIPCKHNKLKAPRSSFPEQCPGTADVSVTAWCISQDAPAVGALTFRSHTASSSCEFAFPDKSRAIIIN